MYIDFSKCKSKKFIFYTTYTHNYSKDKRIFFVSLLLVLIFFLYSFVWQKNQKYFVILLNDKLYCILLFVFIEYYKNNNNHASTLNNECECNEISNTDKMIHKKIILNWKNK